MKQETSGLTRVLFQYFYDTQYPWETIATLYSNWMWSWLYSYTDFSEDSVHTRIQSNIEWNNA